jgi:hypothetical protein
MTSQQDIPYQRRSMDALGQEARFNYAASFMRYQWPSFLPKLEGLAGRQITLRTAASGERRFVRCKTGELASVRHTAGGDEITIGVRDQNGTAMHVIEHPLRVEVAGRDESSPCRVDFVGRDGGRTRLELADT